MRLSPCFVLAALLAAPALQAQTAGAERAPQRLAYAGLLTDDAGDPVPDGAYTLTFRLYATPDASGTPLWTGTREVAATAGRFTALLDAAVPEGSASGGGGGYLTIQVGEAAPSAPVALAASGSSNALGGSLQDAYAAGNVITTSNPPGAVTINGTAGQIAMRINDGDLFFNSNAGTAVQRFRSGQTGQVWQLRAYGTPPTDLPSRFAIRDVTGGGFEPLTILPGAQGSLVTIEPTLVRIGTGLIDEGEDIKGQIEIMGNAILPQTQLLTDGDGGAIYLRRPNGNLNGHFYGSSQLGEGGNLRIYAGGSPSARGVYLEGNYDGTGQPRIRAVGDGSTTILDTGASGDAAVVLPVDAVSATEIQNEAGVAAVGPLAPVAIPAAFTVLAERTITVPAAGHVIALSSMNSAFNHVSGTQSTLLYGLSDDCDASPGLTGQQLTEIVPASTATGSYANPSNAHRIFEATTAGPLTLCLVGTGTSGALDDVALTLLYAPTAYGTVSASAPTGALAERAASLEANQARIERELAQMRALLQSVQEPEAKDPEGE